MRFAHIVFHMPASTATAEWGRRYREARLAKGWTQSELASRTGLNQAVISRVENGAGLSIKNHLTLTTALGITLSDLVDDEPAKDVA